jgi:heptosyltransferase III
MDASDSNQIFQRILVIKLRHLGDVLLSTPVFAALKERFTTAEIYACINPGTGEMLEGNPHVKGTISPPAPGPEGVIRRWKKELQFALEIRRKRFDLVLDLTTSDRSALLSRLSGARTRLGYRSLKGFVGRSRCYTTNVQPARNEHIVRKHLRILRPIGIHESKGRLIFPVAEKDRALVSQLLPHDRPFFQVHPGSRIAKKNWPVAFMSEVVSWMAKRGWLPVVTGSAEAQEKAWIADLCGRVHGEVLDLSGKLTLKQLGAVSERAKCFLGVDTAPMHIAAAVGAPVVALFGPSSERLWAPWCERKLVLSRELDCRLPCKNKHGCQTIHCLREFTPAMIEPELTRFLDTL